MAKLRKPAERRSSFLSPSISSPMMPMSAPAGAEVLLGAFFHSIEWDVKIRWADQPVETSNAAN
jgi:hypothetical protein